MLPIVAELKDCPLADLPGVVWSGWGVSAAVRGARLCDLLHRVWLRLRTPSVSSERSGRGSDCEMSLRHIGFPLLMLQHRLRNRMLRQGCTKLHFCNPAEVRQTLQVVQLVFERKAGACGRREAWRCPCWSE